MIQQELKLKFKQLVNSRCGLYFKDYDLKNMEDALKERMGSLKVDSALSYYNILTASAKKEDEMRELLNLLTVNHTYFFRNEPQFQALRERILPELVNSRCNNQPKPTIRIWSAGCSTGEEPYTIAMLIREAVPDLENWDIRIFATDASTRALEAARKGVYGENSMRLLPEEFKEKYFSKIPGGRLEKKYQISDKIKQMVSFDFLNLIEDEYLYNLDIIFCRNVFIYFELDSTLKILNRFHKCLDDKGYLFIGYSESLQFVSDKYCMQDHQDAIFYRKSEAIEAAPLKIDTKSIEKEVERVLEEISLAEFQAEQREILPEKKPASAQDINQLLVQAIKYIYAKQYSNALRTITQVKEMDRDIVEPYYLAAEVYTNQSRLEEAKKELKNSLKVNPLFAPAHYLFGSIYIQEDDIEKAKQSLKKAVYLEKDFPVAYLSLANIYRNEGKIDEALRAYRNTLNMLVNYASDDIIAHSGGFNAATIVSICRDNIERLKLSA